MERSLPVTMNSTTASDNATLGWAVIIYRHTKDRGWETGGTQLVYASPCVGGVEIRQFRVRIRVFKETSSSAARCTKRRNLLFLSTRSQTGSIILKFRSVAECNDFFDEMLDMNGRKPGSTKECGDDKAKRGSASLHNMDHKDIQRRKQDTLLYLARLLHDDDFQDFVKNVEDSLSSTEDGAKMLEAFQLGDVTPE
jgi:hypothetical protein